MGWMCGSLVLGAPPGDDGLGGLGPDGLDDGPVHVLGGDDFHESGPEGLDVVRVGLVEPGEQVQVCHPLLLLGCLGLDLPIQPHWHSG